MPPAIGAGTATAPPRGERPSAPAAADATDRLSGIVGRSVGSGQCVALVQAADPGIGRTSGWSGGEAVRGNLALRPGTPIATFDGSGAYANALDGSSHAAIYLGQDERGLRVLDQWAGRAAAVRTIPWSGSGAAANAGERYRVVVTEGRSAGARRPTTAT